MIYNIISSAVVFAVTLDPEYLSLATEVVVVPECLAFLVHPVLDAVPEVIVLLEALTLQHAFK